ncbi:MAG TPA: portal protein [Candidatus Paceibacterota bacterium]
MAERDKTIIRRAHDRFRTCAAWEGDARQRFKDDIQFLFADPDNQCQWNAAVRAQRQLAGQPMVTINKTHTHWLHVVNQGKENKPQIQISPTGDEATYESAQIFEQIIRRIEYISDAQTAYDKASEFQVGGGIGYWRIRTRYTDDNTFDQELFIDPVPDPLSVYTDPHIKTQDGSDMRFAFVYDDVPREEAEKKYGKIVGRNTGGSDALAWNRQDTVRVAEYYERSESRDWLYAISRDDGSTMLVRESEMPAEGRALLKEAMDKGAEVQRRRVPKYSVDWYLIVGDEIAEKSEWLGKYIPIIRVPGEEVVIEGRLDRKGLVRYLKDAQRAFNYNASAALEYGALQSKSPYIAPVEAIEGLENYWATANTQNHAYLPFNNRDENGNPVDAPARQQPPASAPVFMDGMQAAEHEMMMASGQYEATFSAQGNEIAGVAIEQRQKQGERVTFHFQDNLAKAIRFTGKQLIDLIPKYYDTKRLIRIMSESGEEQQIQIDPNAKQPVQRQQDRGESKVAAIFNPNVGKYDVQVTVGPNFETRRKQAFDAMTQMLATNQALSNVIGDLYMGNADFPVADKLQERMRNWIKATNPAVLGEIDPQVQQLTGQLQQAAQIIQHLQQQIEDKSVQQQLEAKRVDMDALNHLALRMENDNKAILDAFKAETDRLQAVAKTMTPEALDPIVRKMLAEMLRASSPDGGVTADPVDPANVYAAGIQQVMQPVPQLEQQAQQGAQQAHQSSMNQAAQQLAQSQQP